jgi:glucan phosphorylase
MIPSQVSPLTQKTSDLSLEFLMGRALDNAMLNVGMKDVATGTKRPVAPPDNIPD